MESVRTVIIMSRPRTSTDDPIPTQMTDYSRHRIGRAIGVWHTESWCLRSALFPSPPCLMI